jgi:hypothetical protein
VLFHLQMGNRTHLRCELAFYSGFEELHKLGPKHFILRRRQINGGSGVIELVWGNCIDLGKKLFKCAAHARGKPRVHVDLAYIQLATISGICCLYFLNSEFLGNSSLHITVSCRAAGGFKALD